MLLYPRSMLMEGKRGEVDRNWAVLVGRRVIPPKTG